jgi:high-affinity Fe2+/Pb2+ permease
MLKEKSTKLLLQEIHFFLSLDQFSLQLSREGFEVVLFYAALFTSAIYSTVPVIAGAADWYIGINFCLFRA